MCASRTLAVGAGPVPHTKSEVALCAVCVSWRTPVAGGIIGVLLWTMPTFARLASNGSSGGLSVNSAPSTQRPFSIRRSSRSASALGTVPVRVIFSFSARQSSEDRDRDQGRLESHWLPPDVPGECTLTRVTSGVVKQAITYLECEVSECALL